MMKLITSFITLSTLITLNKAGLIPGLVVQRQTSTNSTSSGGFAMRSETCSTSQVDCGGAIEQEVCCPAGTFCFNSGGTTCCPTNDDCTQKAFLAPQCADPSAYLCTDYLPDTPTYSPNSPGYWCCPIGTQCFVGADLGYVCRNPESGDVAASTVASGQAPTQASTATTFPTLPATAGGTVSAGKGTTASLTKSATTKTAQVTGQSSTPSGTGGGSTAPAKSAAIRISSLLYRGPGLFIVQIAFAFGVSVLQVL